MFTRFGKRLTALTLAVLLCFALPSCSVISKVKDTLLSPISPNEETIGEETSDFDRYVSYLNGLSDGQEVYIRFGYKLTVRPVLENDETVLTYVKESATRNTHGKIISANALTFTVPESGMNARFSFTYVEYADDGSIEYSVTASGILHTPEYDGTLTAFTDYENSRGEYKNAEEVYLEIVNIDMEVLLEDAAILLKRADLTLAALGFTYTPEEAEAN